MKQIEKLYRRLLCRDGPKLEMSSSIRIDHCVERIETDTCLNSIVRSFGNAFAATAERVTDGKLENFSVNVRNGCSTASTSHQTVPSRHRMLCRKLYDQQRPTSVTPNQADHRGRNATIDIWNIKTPEGDKDQLMIRHRVLGSPKQFLTDTFQTTTCLEEC